MSTDPAHLRTKAAKPAGRCAPPRNGRFSLAVLSGAAVLSLLVAGLAAVLERTLPQLKDSVTLLLLQHDLLVFGAVPLAAAAATLTWVLRTGRSGRLLEEAAALLGLTWFCLSFLLTLGHVLLFPRASLAVGPAEAWVALSAGLLLPGLVRLVRGGAAVREDEAETDSVTTRAAIDASCREVVLTWYVSAAFWLVAGSVLALLASYKMHSPYFLGDAQWLTFGRVRPAHLNTMIYGWGSMAAIGTTFWLQGRLSRIRLPYRPLLVVAAIYWNAVVAVGTYQVLAGESTGIEWLEFPPLPATALTLVFALLFLTSLRMLVGRRSGHIYVSHWYLFGSVFWFPFLYLAAMVAMHVAPVGGTVKGVANWWFAHNVLGLWLTPTGLASAYYLIPKIIGRPIHSYYLSLVGFWSLALFYNWAGSHHLIGGPVPGWVVTLGIVGSIMMFIPVITVAINHHLTMVGHFSVLRTSPSLRFVVFGAMSYTVVSVQGSLLALRSLNQTTHFTHYTIAHAHLGVYAFFTMIMFGSVYYILPRVSGREWWSARLIRVHFWTCAVGITIYFVALTWGGYFQGRMMAVPENSHLAVVRYTLPYLQARSWAGSLMTIGHLSFAYLLLRTLLGPRVRPGADAARGKQVAGANNEVAAP